MLSPEMLQLTSQLEVALRAVILGLLVLVILEVAYIASLVATAPPGGGGGSPFTHKFLII